MIRIMITLRPLLTLVAFSLISTLDVFAQTHTFEAVSTWSGYGMRYNENRLMATTMAREGNAPASVCFALSASDADATGVTPLRCVSFQKGCTTYDPYVGDYSRKITLKGADGSTLMVWGDENYAYVKFVGEDPASTVACDLTKEDANRMFDLVEKEVKRLGMKKTAK